MRILPAVAVSALLAACGGAATPAPNTPSTPPAQFQGGGQGGGHEKHEHGDLPPAMKAFHDVLAPVWHDKSPDRAKNACAQALAMNDKAGAVGDADLSAATKAFAAECEKEGRPDFDAKFTAVHERFHAIMQKK
jgi:hypothetical protein